MTEATVLLTSTVGVDVTGVTDVKVVTKTVVIASLVDTTEVVSVTVLVVTSMRMNNFLTDVPTLASLLHIIQYN